MKRAAILGALLLAGCGGADPTETYDAPEAGPPPVEPERVEIPLCVGASEPGPDDCQTLVYNLVTGYCNRWEPCR